MENRLQREDARKWAMAVLAETQAKGFYTSSHYADMPGARWLHQAARDLAFVKPVMTSAGRRNEWLMQEPPSNADVELLFNSANNPDGGALGPVMKRLDELEGKIDQLLYAFE